MIKKRVILGLFGVFVIWLSYCVGVAYAYDIETWNYITIEANTYEYPFDQKIWFIDDSVYFFAYGKDSTDDGAYLMYSDDYGTTWTNNGRFSYDIDLMDEYGFAFWSNQDRFTYAASVSLSNAVGTRRGTFNSTALDVDWDAANQAAMSSLYPRQINIVEDSTEHQYIIVYDDHTNDLVKISKNANTDGTWSTASGYPKTLKSGATNNVAIAADIDENDIIYLTMCNSSSLWIQTFNTTAGTYSEEYNILSADANTDYYTTTLYYNNTLLVAYNDDADLYLIGYQEGVGLGEPYLITSAQATSTPLLTYDTLTRDFFISWFESALYQIQYDYSAGDYLTEVQLSDTIPEIINNYDVFTMKTLYYDEFSFVFRGTSDRPYFMRMSLDSDRTIEEPSTPGTGPDDIWLWLTDRMALWMGLGGLVLMGLTPVLLVKAFKDGDVQGFAIAALITGITGFALVVGWLYG